MNQENYIKQVLQSFGFEVKKIAEGTEQSPDFLVTGKNENYLIELKSKFDDRVEIHKSREILISGNIAEKHDTTGRKNTISKIVRDSVKQLSCIEHAVNFKLVWLHAVDRYQDLKLDQFKSTLYGLVNIFDLDEFSGNLIPCYYFGFNEFFPASYTLDGAVVSTAEKATLCLNTFSPKYECLKNSELAEKFGKGILDPLTQELNGRAFIIDTNIDRKDQRAIIRYLNNKYNRNKLQPMFMGFHSASVLVSNEDS